MADIPVKSVATDSPMGFDGDAVASYPNRVLKTLHDPNVQFEEYLHYARITRGDEERMYGPGSAYRNQHKGVLQRFLPGGRKSAGDAQTPSPPTDPTGISVDEKAEAYMGVRRRSSVKEVISDEEWLTASRAARTATWSAVFFLITTDILGPFTAPWAMSQLGLGPGAALYTIFGAFAGYSGWQLWHSFMGLDSDRYPLKNYGDLTYRIYGQAARHVINVLQSLQFFMNVAIIIIGSAYAITQIVQGAHASLCFIVCSIIFTIAGLIVGQIRTLARFGWLANIAVWINVLTMLFVVIFSSINHPDYQVVFTQTSGGTTPKKVPGLFHLGTTKKPWGNPYPVSLTGGTPAGLTFQNNIIGLMQAVYSYGGATMFCEIMAEMRRPWDFWKGLLVADSFIYFCYMFYGLYVYGMQGQFTFITSYQGITPYNWQTVCNVLQLITTIIAAALYGNIGIKVLYANIGRDVFHFPPLESIKGKWIWVFFVPLYWFTAFVVSSSIPQFANFSALIGALCILQFTYTFPPWLSVGYKVQRDAILPEETFDPNTGIVNRVDSGMSRWIRGFKKQFVWNCWDTVYCLGALTTAILGIYSAIYNMHIAYVTLPNQVGWQCTPPI